MKLLMGALSRKYMPCHPRVISKRFGKVLSLKNHLHIQEFCLSTKLLFLWYSFIQNSNILGSDFIIVMSENAMGILDNANLYLISSIVLIISSNRNLCKKNHFLYCCNVIAWLNAYVVKQGKQSWGEWVLQLKLKRQFGYYFWPRRKIELKS